MGITYKAVDVHLHRPATLKVINERYLGDESAQLRFLREARAAASVRHPNVASVFHLGRTGSGYFYAMEFVEGETLEHLINHWLRRMAAKHYRSADLVFGWSFYRQGSSGGASSAENFLRPLSLGLEIQILGLERLGRRAKDRRRASRIVT
jgi:serine/threonine protein kinase